MIRFNQTRLVRTFSLEMNIKPGDVLISGEGQIRFLVLGIEKPKHTKSFFYLLAFREDGKTSLEGGVVTGTEEHPYSFRVPYENGARVACDLWGWYVEQERITDWFPYDNKQCMHFGRVMVDGQYSILCSKCGEEGPQTDSAVAAREQVIEKRWFLEEAYFDKNEHLIEKWSCHECLYDL